MPQSTIAPGIPIFWRASPTTNPPTTASKQAQSIAAATRTGGAAIAAEACGAGDWPAAEGSFMTGPRAFLVHFPECLALDRLIGRPLSRFLCHVAMIPATAAAARMKPLPTDE